MIATTFALPTESSRFVSQLKHKQRAGNLIRGEIGAHSIAVLHTGVGRKICESRIANFIREQHPEILISSGFAGAVASDLEVGDLFLAQNFSDAELLSLAQRTLGNQRLHVGNLFTSPSIVDSVSERNRIAQEHAAAAVDMETEAIATACAESGTRMISLRVITDTPSQPFPAPPFVLFDLERQRTNFAGVARHFLTRPMQLLRLACFARQINHAREKLAIALLSLLKAIR